MVDIDERVVQMKFDATDFDQNTKKTMSTLDKLREKLSFKDVVDNNAMNSIADNVQKVADKAYTIVDRTIDKIKDNIANKLVSFIQDNTIGQLNAGWSKYADMTTSVATLKAQGYAIDDITEQLERLMYFTDETSYKFTDMVGEVGKFTASGQKLDDSVKAMMGIADWAALSGKNANDASRAMYQLSQALGAGYIRLQDWKSIQILNMDTKEFRENALKAAESVGTIKKNVDNTYTSLVGDKKTFNIKEFSETLSKGQWFTTDVMMKVFGEYADAVDEIRALYMENDEEIPTAQIIEGVKASNEELIEKFNQVNFKGTRKDITDIIARWKQVEKVTAETAEEYAAINDLTVKQAKLQMAEKQNGYAEYLKEYGQIFGGTIKEAEDALDDWHNYISEFGIKAFQSGQEAKTFMEAIESAKDAASTVWTNIYTTIFGDYNEAKEIWSHLANNLYEIFVERLWSVADIFDYWKNAGKEALTVPLKEAQEELAVLQRKRTFNIISDDEIVRLHDLEEEIKNLKYQLKNGLYKDGRRMFMQGIESIGMSFMSVLRGVRKAWDATFAENESGEKLLAWTERFRLAAFRFAVLFLDEKEGLPSTDFYKNIAAGLKNLVTPINAVRKIIHDVIQQFLPAGTTFIGVLVKMSEGFKNLTAKIVPSQQTIQNIARILRGVVAVIKLIGKATYGLYQTFLKPIFSIIYTVVHDLTVAILGILADIGDTIYELEEGVDSFEAMAIIADIIKDALDIIWNILKNILGVIWMVIGPVVGIIYRTIKSIVTEIKKLVTGGNGGFLENVAAGFKKIADRTKEAWHSTASLSDVWNHYSSGSGIMNFLMMLGDMLDTIITKIGVTILALFGLEEETANGKMAGTLNTIKDIIIGAATVIRFVYTTVLRPILATFIEGLGAMATNLGKQWKDGDFIGVLGTIKEIFKTFTAIGLFKFINVITKVFGAGGLLRVIRNAAKAIKSIGNYFGAKAFNEIAGGVIKLAIAFSILTAAAAALSFLPEEKMSKFIKTMIVFGVALTVAMGAVFAISVVAEKSKFGLIGLGLALIGIVGVVYIFIKAANALVETLGHLFMVQEKYIDKDGKEKTRYRDANTLEIIGGILTAILPIIASLGAIWLIMRLIKSIGGGTAFINFGLALSGLGIGIFFFVQSIHSLVDLFGREDADLPAKVSGAILLLLSIMTALALITQIISKLPMVGRKASSGVSSAIAIALEIAAIALVVRAVIIPVLQTLVDSGYSFGDYLAGLAIIAGAMFTIAGTIYIISRDTGGFLNKLAGGIVFIMFAKILQNTVIPLINIITETGINGNTILAVGMIAAIVFIIAHGMEMIFNGLSEIFKAIGTLRAKNLVPIIITIGGIIAGIMLLGSYIKKNGNMMNIEEIGSILAAVGSTLLLLGLFAILMNREFGKSAAAMNAFSKLLVSMSVIITVIALSLGGLLIAMNIFYKDNSSTGIVVLLASAVSIVIAIGGSLLAFSNAVSDVTSVLSGKSKDRVDQIITLFKTLFITIGAVLTIIVGGVALIGHVYKDNILGLIITFIGIIISTFVAISVSMNELAAVMDDIITVFNKPGVGPKTIEHITNILKILFIAIGAIMIVIIAGVTLITGLTEKNVIRTLLPALEIVGGTILAFKVISSDFVKMAESLSEIKTDRLKVIQTTLLILFVTIAGIMLVIAGGTAGILAQMNGTNEWYDTLASAGSIALGAVLAFIGIARAFEKLAVTLSTVASFNLKNIIATMGIILVITGLMSTIMVALMNWMAGTGVGGEQNLMNAAAIILAVIVPFAALVGIIELMIPTAGPFVGAAAKIAGGIFLIGGAISVLAASLMMLKEAFGIGQSVTEGVAKGIEDNAKAPVRAVDQMNTDIIEAEKEGLKINSPSKVFAEDGKFIDQGLAQGIKKNTSLAASASKALATATNTAFQKELKIASPSKVFYENGKFVIRGFINGANSEYKKNKDIGSAMGEGFAETATKSISDEFAKLWSDESEGGPLADMKKALAEAGSNFGDNAVESLFGNIFGDNTVNDEAKNYNFLSLEDKEKELKRIDDAIAKENKAIDDDINKFKKEHKGKITFAEEAEIRKKHLDEIDRLKEERSTYEFKFNPTYGQAQGLEAINALIFQAEQEMNNEIAKAKEANNGVISAEEESRIKVKYAERLKDLEQQRYNLQQEIARASNLVKQGASKSDVESSSKGFIGQLLDIFKKAGNDAGDLMGDSVLGKITGFFSEGNEGFDKILSTFDTALGTAGGTGAEKFQSKLFETFGLDKENNDIVEIGKKVGGGFVKGLLDAVGGALDKIASTVIYPLMQAWNMMPDVIGGLSDADFNAWKKQHGFDYEDPYNPNYNKQTYGNRDNEIKSNVKIANAKTYTEPGIHNYTETAEERAKREKYEQGVIVNLKGDAITLWNNLTKDGYYALQELDTNSKVYRDLYAKLVEVNHSIGFNELADALQLIYTKKSIIQAMSLDKAKEYLNVNGLGDNIDTWMNNLYGMVDYGNVSRTLKDNGVIFSNGKQKASFYLQGFQEGWLQNIDGVLTIVGKTNDEVVEIAAKHLGEKSPSVKAAQQGRYYLEGFENGIDEEIPKALDSIGNATDLITDETIAGLNGMQYMLDNDITPTVTPVFDGGQLQNGVDTINSALDSVQPRVDSAIGSFGIESTDYTNNLTSLQNRIDNLTNVVDSFMTMIESGAGVNINVTAEPDPTNIYNLVVDTNRTEFKRTGRNNLAY